MSRDTTTEPDATDLAPARARRWWVRGRRIRSVERAGSFIDDVGFALLFPAPKLHAPTLWEAVADEDDEPFASGMEENEARVWGWKDDLPRRGLAWYGTYLAGRGSFLSPTLLAALYPGEGELDDHRSMDLSPVAHELAEALAAEPMSSAALRVLIGDRNRYQRAMTELQRHLLVTNAGKEESKSGWPASLISLTCEQFDVGHAQDHGLVAERFLDTMLVATPAELARTFRWPTAKARTHLDDLVDAGRARLDGSRYELLDD